MKTPMDDNTNVLPINPYSLITIVATTRQWDHAINLKEGFKPKVAKNYPLSIHEEQLMNKWIDEQLKKGYIRPSQSLQASPFFYVAKKEKGELRPCQDYRYINQWTK